MKIERLSLALALVNVVLLLHVLGRPRSTMAEGVAPVLRGRALEIVDDEGRVRATITVLPATGKPHPETVLLRLIDAKGRPAVKVGASEQGSGLSFVGESDRTQVVLKAEGASSSLKLADADGREQLFKP
jgi:hypothetical protein